MECLPTKGRRSESEGAIPYVYQVREYAKEMAFSEAVEKAVDYCIKHGILADFLSKNRAEAIAVSIFEYDEEKHIKNEKKLSYQEGLRQGEEIGQKLGEEIGEKRGKKLGEEIGEKRGLERFALLNKKLVDENRMEDLKNCIMDERYREKLFAEYGI